MQAFLCRATLVAACVSALALAGCGKHVDSNAPISFAPADTPYVFANFKATPQDVQQAWNPNRGSSIQASIQKLGSYASVLAKDDPVLGKVLQAIEAELANAHSQQEYMDTVGLSSSALFAIYGIGDVPVMRMQLASADKFKAFWARVEKRAGISTPTANAGQQPYWTIGGSDAKLHLLVAVEGQQLVATLAPVDASEAMVKQLLGVTKPSSNAADRLAEINSEHGYGDYGSGYVDVPKLFANALGGKDAVTQAFLKSVGDGAAASNPACATEFASLAEQLPLASGGYQTFTAEQVRFGVDLKLSPSLLGVLTALKQPVPGMDVKSDDSVVDLVLALPLQKWQAFLKSRAEAAAAKTYQCPALASLNDFAKTAANPPVQMPPEATSLLGFRVVLDKLEAGPQIAARVLVASSNPSALVQKIEQTMPQFALKSIPADGKPVAFDLPPNAQAMLGGSNQGWIATNGKAIAIGVGDGEQARLGDALNASAGNGDTLLRMHLDGKIYPLIASWFGRFAARAQPATQAQLQQTVTVLNQMGKIVKSQDMRVTLDAKGLHIDSAMQHR